MSGRRLRGDEREPGKASGGIDAGQSSHGCRLGVSFNPDQLAGEKYGPSGFQLQRIAKQLRRINERVPMQTAVPKEFRLFETGDHAKDAPLFRIREFCLESDHIVTGSMDVLGAQLHDRTGTGARPWIIQSDRFQRTELHRLASPFRHHFDGNATLEVRDFLEVLRLNFFRRDNGVIKCIIGHLIHRAIQIIIPSFSVSRRAKRDIHIDGIGINNRRNCIKECKVLLVSQLSDRRRYGRYCRCCPVVRKSADAVS